MGRSLAARATATAVLLLGLADPSLAAPQIAPDESLEKAWARVLDAEIARILPRFNGRISVYASDLALGARYAHDVDKPTYLASGVKVAFMVEVFRQKALGRLTLDEKLTYREEDVRDGAPVLNRLPFGKQLTISELLAAMIHHSDNAASDLLAKRVGLDNINRGLVELGFDGFTKLTYLIDVRRGVFREVDPRSADFTPLQIRALRWTPIWEPQARKFTQMVGKPPGTYTKQHLLQAYERFYATGVNSARLDSVGKVLEKLARRELISSEASDAMLKLMFGAETSRRRILGRLPKGTAVAHKTGSQFERTCDLGVIQMKKGEPLVFAACVAGSRDSSVAEAAIAALARKAFDLSEAARVRPR